MKSFKLAVALSALTLIANAQWTGQSYYSHAGSPAILSSGTYVNTNPGFIMAGYKPTAAAGTPNFYIDKVDIAGRFAIAPVFSKGYALFDAGASCTGTTTQETTCFGTSIVEGLTTSGMLEYATATGFKNAVLFATVDNAGNVLANSTYNFPSGATASSKPLIAFSSTGDYYVCGSYRIGISDYMYAFRVTPAASSVWSKRYDLGTTVVSTTFTPKAIIEDNYSSTGPELAIVGVFCVNNNGFGDTDGFLVTLNGASGAINYEEALASGQITNEGISSIAISNNAPAGYILGGTTDVNSGSGHAWMVKLTPAGVMNWTSRINPSTNPTAGDVVGVVERFSSVYNAYEYYGATVSGGGTGGMMVLKLDASGNPFSRPGNTNNEFLYNDGTGSIAVPVSISQRDMGPGGTNTGIHVFGTTKTGPAQFFLDQACFNGATGNCIAGTQQKLTNIVAVNVGPSVTYTPTINVTPGPTRCDNIKMSVTNIQYAPTQPCTMNTTPTTPFLGNNNRTANATGIAVNSANSSELGVFPNPVSDVAEISYTAIKDGEVKISLYNAMGQQIRVLETGQKSAGTNTLRLDMGSMNLDNGVYIVNITVDGATSQQKVIFNKNQ